MIEIKVDAAVLIKQYCLRAQVLLCPQMARSLWHKSALVLYVPWSAGGWRDVVPVKTTIYLFYL